jgi:hypothetical protein
MELASCHPFGAWNFEVAPRFLTNLCTLLYTLKNFLSYFFFPSFDMISVITAFCNRKCSFLISPQTIRALDSLISTLVYFVSPDVRLTVLCRLSVFVLSTCSLLRNFGVQSSMYYVFFPEA